MRAHVLALELGPRSGELCVGHTNERNGARAGRRRCPECAPDAVGRCRSRTQWSEIPLLDEILEEAGVVENGRFHAGLEPWRNEERRDTYPEPVERVLLDVRVGG